MKFEYIFANRSDYTVKKMAAVLEVSESGYHAWYKRIRLRIVSRRKRENDELKDKILKIYWESNGVYGHRKITKKLRNNGVIADRKRVKHIMDTAGLRSIVRNKYKATTNSKHNYPVAPNILNRQFYASRPNQKLVSDITYIWTDEGWLYLAAILDLCGRRIVGTAMSSRMTKDLVIDALQDAVGRIGQKNCKDCILHSDRGSQYCSTRYQNLLKSYGFVCSMSRKGNCWDNSPMECFWGKLKMEWLNTKRFKTRDEARAAVFEYIWIFYNRKRIHASNDYETPDEYYYNRVNQKSDSLAA
jgi:Transposase and inactivated derivatives